MNINIHNCNPNILEQVSFFLLVFSTVIIAAAGNIINDYFDVKADKVNKPHKVIIGKYIKPRWAIFWHWVLNFIAFSIALYLSIVFKSFWYVFIHLLSINLLWLYSMRLKRSFLIGNIVISLLTALVPILAGIYLNQVFSDYRDYLPAWSDNKYFNNEEMKLLVVFIFASFAFFMNLVREIIKDVEDVEGDKVLKAKTIPIVLGERKARIISLMLLIFILVSSILGLYFFTQDLNIQLRLIDYILFGVIAFFLFLAIFFLKSTERKQLKYADRSLKVAMIIGSLLPLIWSLIVVKG
jgi:4-hydroxybenzoate polyprenyltransferase